MMKYLIILLIIFLMGSCAGNKPQPHTPINNNLEGCVWKVNKFVLDNKDTVIINDNSFKIIFDYSNIVFLVDTIPIYGKYKLDEKESGKFELFFIPITDRIQPNEKYRKRLGKDFITLISKNAKNIAELKKESDYTVLWYMRETHSYSFQNNNLFFNFKYSNLIDYKWHYGVGTLILDKLN